MASPRYRNTTFPMYAFSCRVPGESAIAGSNLVAISTTETSTMLTTRCDNDDDDACRTRSML